MESTDLFIVNSYLETPIITMLPNLSVDTSHKITELVGEKFKEMDSRALGNLKCVIDLRMKIINQWSVLNFISYLFWKCLGKKTSLAIEEEKLIQLKSDIEERIGLLNIPPPVNKDEDIFSEDLIDSTESPTIPPRLPSNNIVSGDSIKGSFSEIELGEFPKKFTKTLEFSSPKTIPAEIAAQNTESPFKLPFQRNFNDLQNQSPASPSHIVRSPYTTTGSSSSSSNDLTPKERTHLNLKKKSTPRKSPKSPFSVTNKTSANCNSPYKNSPLKRNGPPPPPPQPLAFGLGNKLNSVLIGPKLVDEIDPPVFDPLKYTQLTEEELSLQISEIRPFLEALSKAIKPVVEKLEEAKNVQENLNLTHIHIKNEIAQINENENKIKNLSEPKDGVAYLYLPNKKFKILEPIPYFTEEATRQINESQSDKKVPNILGIVKAIEELKKINKNLLNEKQSSEILISQQETSLIKLKEYTNNGIEFSKLQGCLDKKNALIQKWRNALNNRITQLHKNSQSSSKIISVKEEIPKIQQNLIPGQQEFNSLSGNTQILMRGQNIADFYGAQVSGLDIIN